MKTGAVERELLMCVLSQLDQEIASLDSYLMGTDVTFSRKSRRLIDYDVWQKEMNTKYRVLSEKKAPVVILIRSVLEALHSAPARDVELIDIPQGGMFTNGSVLQPSATPAAPAAVSTTTATSVAQESPVATTIPQPTARHSEQTKGMTDVELRIVVTELCRRAGARVTLRGSLVGQNVDVNVVCATLEALGKPNPNPNPNPNPIPNPIPIPIPNPIPNPNPNPNPTARFNAPIPMSKYLVLGTYYLALVLIRRSELAPAVRRSRARMVRGR